jgi:LPS-assembly lipoprotein
MWWRKPRIKHDDFGHHASAGEPPPRPRGRRYAPPALLTILCLTLSACGFHPLYSKSGADANLREEMSQIAIAPLRDRQGQEIHNALIKSITPDGQPEKPRFNLIVAYSVTETNAALATDETATRDVMRFNVMYRLYEGPTIVTTGTFPEIFSYNFLQEHYANVSAQADIMSRVSDQIALEVRNRLAIYFTTAAEQKAKAAAAAAEAAKAAADKTPK